MMFVQASVPLEQLRTNSIWRGTGTYLHCLYSAEAQKTSLNPLDRYIVKYDPASRPHHQHRHPITRSKTQSFDPLYTATLVIRCDFGGPLIGVRIYRVPRYPPGLPRTNKLFAREATLTIYRLIIISGKISRITRITRITVFSAILTNVSPLPNLWSQETIISC